LTTSLLQTGRSWSFPTIPSSLERRIAFSQAGLGSRLATRISFSFGRLNETINSIVRYRGGRKDSRASIALIVSMDVTSLLNSNPAAAEQRKRADSGNSGSSRAPSRSRTPWDAGGYSLPINTATKATISPQQQTRPEIRHDDVSISTPPPSPKHRFSDSRSSVSSFTSSLQSPATHSRYSSTSTLYSNSHAHHKSFGTDILSPELGGICQALESTTQSLVIDSCQASETRQGISLSPIGSPLEQLALVAECQRPETGSRYKDRMETAATDFAAEGTLKSVPYTRPGSPSDAILIKRTSIPSLRVNTEDLSGNKQR
jgi:hypothetical protein